MYHKLLNFRTTTYNFFQKPQSREVHISEEKSLDTEEGDADESKIVKYDLRDSPDESDEDYFERSKLI